MSTTKGPKCRICGAATRKDNGSGAHWRCYVAEREERKAARRAGLDVAPSSTAPPTEEQFRSLARGLGLEPAELVERFQRDWISRVANGAMSALGQPQQLAAVGE